MSIDEREVIHKIDSKAAKIRRKFLIFPMLILALVFHSSCRRKSDMSLVVPRINKTGTLRWRADFADYTWIDINAYLFQNVPNLEEDFKQRVSLRNEAVRWCLKMNKMAPTQELRKSYLEELDMRVQNKWAWRDVDCWLNWPFVIVSPVLQKDSSPTKALIICRYQRKNSNFVDIIFTMYSPDELTFNDLLRTIRKLTLDFESLNEEEWSQMPIEKQLLNAEGEIISEEIAKFAAGGVFLEQH